MYRIVSPLNPRIPSVCRQAHGSIVDNPSSLPHCEDCHCILSEICDEVRSCDERGCGLKITIYQQCPDCDAESRSDCLTCDGEGYVQASNERGVTLAGRELLDAYGALGVYVTQHLDKLIELSTDTKMQAHDREERTRILAIREKLRRKI